MLDKLIQIIDIIVNFLESFGLIGGFLLVILESIIPVLPLGIFIGLNVLAYGTFLGFFISYIATIIGCMISFWLFRNLLRNYLYRIFKGKSKYKLEKWMKKMSEIDFNTLVVVLAMPFTPAFIVNIAAGLSHINNKKYLVALLISKIAIIYFWGYVGTSLLESIKDPIIIIKIIVVVFIAYIISKIIEKIFKVEE